VTSLGWVYDRVRGRGASAGSVAVAAEEDQEDIVLPVRRNPADRERIREAAILEGQRWIVGTRQVDWDTTVVATMVRTVQAAGGRVVFLTLPLSDAMSIGLRTSAAQTNRQRFDEALVRWGTPRMEVPLPLVEDDFPDLWHISRQGRARFTAALINTWAAGPHR